MVTVITVMEGIPRTVSNKLYDYINNKLSINNELTLMIPSSSDRSLFAVDF